MCLIQEAYPKISEKKEQSNNKNISKKDLEAKA